MMKSFFLKILGGILTIFLADKLLKEVKLEVFPGESHFLTFSLTEYWHVLVLVGTILGLINFFIKPILDKITLPLKLLTFGIFGLVLNMSIIWVLDFLFLEFDVATVFALFLIATISFCVNLILKLIS